MRECLSCGAKLEELECIVNKDGKVECPKCNGKTERVFVGIRRINIRQMKEEENR